MLELCGILHPIPPRPVVVRVTRLTMKHVSAVTCSGDRSYDRVLHLPAICCAMLLGRWHDVVFLDQARRIMPRELLGWSTHLLGCPVSL